MKTLFLLALVACSVLAAPNRSYPDEERLPEQQSLGDVDFLDDEVISSPEEARRFWGWVFKLIKFAGKLFAKHADTAVSVATTAIDAIPQPKPQQFVHQFSNTDQLVNFLDEAEHSMSPEESRRFITAMFGAFKEVIGGDKPDEL